MSSDKLKAIIFDALEDIKALDIVELDIREKSTFAEFMFVVSGTSNRHLQAIVNNVSDSAKEAGFEHIGREGSPGSEWVLIDYGDIVVHVMLPETRAYYDMERLWQGPGPGSLA